MNKAAKYSLIGFIVMLVYALWIAPASLVKDAIEDSSQLKLTQIKGSLWLGSAMLSISNNDFGTLYWSLNPSSLFLLKLSYDIDLDAPENKFSGQLARGFSQTYLSGGASIGSETINRVLANYDIRSSGQIDIQALTVVLDNTRKAGHSLPLLNQLYAQLEWEGGPIQYRLAGQSNHLELPALVGTLQLVNQLPDLKIFQKHMANNPAPANGAIPLILGSLSHDGWISLAITKRFTKLLNQPWPGSEPDHAVVLEVEEKLL